jgi:hypothetical protein
MAMVSIRCQCNIGMPKVKTAAYFKRIICCPEMYLTSADSVPRPTAGNDSSQVAATFSLANPTLPIIGTAFVVSVAASVPIA